MLDMLLTAHKTQSFIGRSQNYKMVIGGRRPQGMQILGQAVVANSGYSSRLQVTRGNEH